MARCYHALAAPCECRDPVYAERVTFDLRVRAPTHVLAGGPVTVTIDVTCARPVTLRALELELRPRGSFGVGPRAGGVLVLGRTVLPAGTSTFTATLELAADQIPTLALGDERHELAVCVIARRPWRRALTCTCDVLVGTAPTPGVPTMVRAPAGEFVLELGASAPAIGEALAVELRLPAPATDHWQFSAVMVPVLLSGGRRLGGLPEQPLVPLTVVERGAAAAATRAVLPGTLAPSFVAPTSELRWLLRLLVVRPDPDRGSPTTMAIDVPLAVTGHAARPPASSIELHDQRHPLTQVMDHVALRRGWAVTLEGPRLTMLRAHPAGVLAMWVNLARRVPTFDLGVSWHGAAEPPGDSARRRELMRALAEGGSGATMAAPAGASDGARVHLVSSPLDFARLDELAHDVVALADAHASELRPAVGLTWGALADELGGRPALADLAIVGELRGRTVQTRVVWAEPLAAPVVRVQVGSPAQASEATRSLHARAGELPGAAAERLATLLATLPTTATAVELERGVLRADLPVPAGQPLAEAGPTRSVVQAMASILERLDGGTAPYR